MLRHITREKILGFAVYLGVASVGFTVNITARILYSEQVHIPFGISVVLSYCTGMVVAFGLAKAFAFGARNSGNTYREMIKFFMVSMVALGVTLLFSLICLFLLDLVFSLYPEFHKEAVMQISQFGHKFINRELFSHLFGIGFGFFANFFGHKLFTFRSTGFWDRYIEGSFITKQS